MNRTPSDCVKNLAIVEAEKVLQWIRQLSDHKDHHRTSSEAPDMQPPAKVAEFCDVYDHVVLALCGPRSSSDPRVEESGGQIGRQLDQ